MSDDTPALGGLSEDVEDLRAMIHDFAAQLERNTKLVDQISAGGAEAGQDGKKKEKPKTPPFILRLKPEEYDRELFALAVWVRDLLVPTYLNEVGSSSTWCANWWEHPAAVARLHALWLAWQELTDPETCGRTGPSVFHRDHLDPTMAQLRAADGPFAGCMTTPDREQHTELPTPPVVPLPGSPAPASLVAEAATD